MSVLQRSMWRWRLYVTTRGGDFSCRLGESLSVKNRRSLIFRHKQLALQGPSEKTKSPWWWEKGNLVVKRFCFWLTAWAVNPLLFCKGSSATKNLAVILTKNERGRWARKKDIALLTLWLSLNIQSHKINFSNTFNNAGSHWRLGVSEVGLVETWNFNLHHNATLFDTPGLSLGNQVVV